MQNLQTHDPKLGCHTTAKLLSNFLIVYFQFLQLSHCGCVRSAQTGSGAALSSIVLDLPGTALLLSKQHWPTTSFSFISLPSVIQLQKSFDSHQDLQSFFLTLFYSSSVPSISYLSLKIPDQL